MKPEFVHLHVHSDYSFLDGACKINDLVKRVGSLGMKACALTDHGNMLGAIEFYDAALKSGIRPIIGMEAYIAPRSRLDRKEVKGMKEPHHHLTLLVRNEKGYRNLLKLTSASYKEGFYSKPRMDKELLSAHHEGLIALSGCSNSEFGQACRTDQMDKALKAADDFRQIFGPDNFYLEVQNHGLEEEKKIFQGAQSAARDLGLRLVATNNVHYMSRDDDKAQDAVLALGEGKLVSDLDRLRYPTPEFYLKSPEEMAQAFSHCPEALKASVEIGDRCNLELRFNEIHLPKFDLPAGQEKAGDYLRHLCEDGAKAKFGDPIPQNVRSRMDYELGVMEKMGFASYFLIVWDLRRFAIQNGMRVGPGRGSAAGSLVSYLLDITLVDPLRYGLIFERFLNPSRKEMPDIDLDFSDEDRGRIIEYIFERYGRDKVAQIITYGTLKARAVLRDVGRVLGIDLKRVDQLAKKIPKVLDISLHDAARMEPEIQKEIEQDPQVKELWEISLRLEGNARHAGKHASGVVICDRSLEEIVPLYTLDEAVMTQYDMNAITKLGILKIDILGLETLTVLDRATKLIEQVQGVKVDLGKIPLDDKDTYAMLGRGTVKGVFQLETSRGMRELVQKMKPDRIDDLIATIALFRPGPLQSGMVESYIRCKHKLEPIKSLHPSIDPILAETNGVILYQEQVMRIANVMAGFSMADADGLRKAMGKKIPEIMAKYKEQFVKGAVKAGVKEETAVQVFDLMAFFAGYGFNKCLSGSTGLVDARTGRRTTLGELFEDRRPFAIHALGEDGGLRIREVTDILENGVKQVFELRTAQGRTLKATANHPFRTLEGWTNLEDLHPGDRIASPRCLKIDSDRSWPEHELIALADLFSEGNLFHPTRLDLFGDGSGLQGDVTKGVAQVPPSTAELNRRRNGHREGSGSGGTDRRSKERVPPWNPRNAAAATAVEAPPRSGTFRWADSLRIFGASATQTSIPEELFELRDADLERFLARLWSRGGVISSENQPIPSYATSSLHLATDVQSLLLRLGMQSGVGQKNSPFKGGRPGYTVELFGIEAAAAFLDRIAPNCIGQELQIEQLRSHVHSKAERSTRETAPPEVWKWIKEDAENTARPWAEVAQATGIPIHQLRANGNPPKEGPDRETLSKLADLFRSRRLREMATSDIFWDRIVSIEPAGEEQTYDLTVEGDHNFVADGLIVHNSHSAAYGFISYQTAYLKSKWPVEYMAAGMSVAMGDTDKLASYIEECRQLGIEVLPPDINTSNLDFTVTEKKIRFGLGAVKGAGEKAIQSIVEARTKGGRFESIYQFCERIDSKYVDKKVVEQLVRCGAFDSTGGHRAQVMEALEEAMRVAGVKQADRRAGQLSIFDTMGAGNGKSELPDVPPWPQESLLVFEREVLGCYVTSNPLLRYEEILKTLSTATVDHMSDLQDGAEVTMGGMITGLKAMITKTGKNAGQKYVMFKFADLTGSTEAVCFASDFEKNREYLLNDAIVFCAGRIGFREDTPSLRVSLVTPMEKAREMLAGSVRLTVSSTGLEEDLIRQVQDVMKSHPGPCPVFFEVEVPGGRKVLVKTANEHFVSPSERFFADIEGVLGTGHVRLAGKPTR